MRKGKWRMIIALLFCLYLFFSVGKGAAWAMEVVSQSGRLEEGSFENNEIRENDFQNVGTYDSGLGGNEAEETEPIEKHFLIKTERKEATCAGEGNIEYWICEDCGKIFRDAAGMEEITNKTEVILPRLTEHTWDEGVVTQEPSCIREGIRTYTCKVCQSNRTDSIPSVGHKYTNKITKATMKMSGKISNQCTVCGDISKQTVIPRIKKITISKTSYIYNGKTHAPQVRVVDAKGKKISTKYYVVKNTKAKNVGTHKMKINFLGRYKGSIVKKFKINPQKVTIVSLTSEKKGFTIEYKKQSKQCSGYQLQYARDPGFSNAVRVTLKQGISRYKISNLENAAAYYVRMRAYTNVKENGKVKKYYSAWSKKKMVKTKEVKLICIDAGHQQRGDNSLEPIGPAASSYKAKVASGTSGVATGKPEYQLTLEVALKLQEELVRRGYDVLMIRTTHEVNISNSARAEIANNAQADAFIRIHANGSDNANASGAITICQTPANIYCGAYYYQSRRLSEQILENFVAACGCRNGGVWETDTMSGINWCSVPVTILEMGYMTNPAEDRLMSDSAYQDRMVQGIANGIDAYF